MSFSKFHCHVYFDEKTEEKATLLYEKAKQDFPDLSVGTFHKKLVGPHLKWNFYMGFGEENFLRVNQWLMQNRAGLEVLVHADTGYDLIDHTERCFWYGENIGLDESKLDPDPV